MRRRSSRTALLVGVVAVTTGCATLTAGDFDIANHNADIRIVGGQISTRICHANLDGDLAGLRLGPTGHPGVAPSSSNLDRSTDPPCLTASFPEAALGAREAQPVERSLTLQTGSLFPGSNDFGRALLIQEIVIVPPLGGARPGSFGWSPITAGPPARAFAAAAGLSRLYPGFGLRNQVVVVGGLDSADQPLGDTWVYEQDQGSWKRHLNLIEPRSEAALARVRPGGREPSADDHLVLFGGLGADGAPLDDTLTWNGERWSTVAPTGPRPAARSGHAMATIGVGQVLLYGGEDIRTGTVFDDTWIWESRSNRWRQVGDPRRGPGPRTAHMMAATPEGRAVLHGGLDAEGSFPDGTWVFRAGPGAGGDQWFLIQATTRVGPRSHAAFAPTSDFGHPVLVAGYPGGPGTVFSTSAFRWTGTTWMPVSLFPGSPRAGLFGAYLHGEGGGLITGTGIERPGLPRGDIYRYQSQL